MAKPKIPAELKVKVGAFFAYVGSLGVLTVLGWLGDADLVAHLPDWLSAPVAAAIPAALAYWRAYQADHTPRPDLDTKAR